MDNLGLEDGDDALQYALMLSMDERERGSTSTSSLTIDDYQPVVGAEVDANDTGDHADIELQEMLEEIRLAEEREREREREGRST